MDPYRETPLSETQERETKTLVDCDGNVWARLNCRDCLLKGPNEPRMPVWVPCGTGSGSCQRCRTMHDLARCDPPGGRGFNTNLLRGDIHRDQYDGERLCYSGEGAGDW